MAAKTLPLPSPQVRTVQQVIELPSMALGSQGSTNELHDPSRGSAACYEPYDPSQGSAASYEPYDPSQGSAACYEPYDPSQDSAACYEPYDPSERESCYEPYDPSQGGDDVYVSPLPNWGGGGGGGRPVIILQHSLVYSRLCGQSHKA